jgi:hypothetical protein
MKAKATLTCTTILTFPSWELHIETFSVCNENMQSMILDTF